MSQHNRNSHPIFPIGAIAGIIGAIAGVIGTCIAILTYLDIKPEDLIPSAVIPTPRVDWEKATLAKTLTEHPNAVWSVAIGPDGKTLAIGGYETIKIWQAGASK